MEQRPQLSPVMEHGGDLGDAINRFGGVEAEWLDLSTGINPNAYPVEGLVPSEDAAWHRLPSKAAQKRLAEAARVAYGICDRLDLVAAPGTEVLIARLPAVVHGDQVAVVGPTYSSHALHWRRHGRVINEIPSLDALPATARVAVLVNPNNPDGRIVAPDRLLEVGRRLAAVGGALIVDEAFADVVPDASVLPHLRDERELPVLVLRSFGKFFGLAGLRLGFAAGPAAVIDRLRSDLGGWAVSGPALSIGAAALADLSFQAAMRGRLAAEAAALDARLERHGLRIAGGTTLYRLVEHPEAAALHCALAQRRIWVRAFAHVPTWLRIGLPGSPEALDRFDAALGDALAGR